MKYMQKLVIGLSAFLSGFFIAHAAPATAPTSIPPTQTLANPIQYNNLADFVKAILEVVVEIGVLVLGIMIIYSGFLFVTAHGNETKLETAKKTFIWVVIGGAIILGAWALSLAISDTVTALRPTP